MGLLRNKKNKLSTTTSQSMLEKKREVLEAGADGLDHKHDGVGELVDKEVDKSVVSMVEGEKVEREKSMSSSSLKHIDFWKHALRDGYKLKEKEKENKEKEIREKEIKEKEREIKERERDAKGMKEKEPKRKLRSRALVAAAVDDTPGPEEPAPKSLKEAKNSKFWSG